MALYITCPNYINVTETSLLGSPDSKSLLCTALLNVIIFYSKVLGTFSQVCDASTVGRRLSERQIQCTSVNQIPDLCGHAQFFSVATWH